MEEPIQSRKPWSRANLLICLTLTLLTVAAYSRVAGFGFLNYDDPGHIAYNPHVRGGLTPQGVLWAFTTFSQANWFPLTWLSHMASCEFFGLRPGPHHLVNVAIHLLASLALFGFLLSATRARWPSAFVAFVFALHPLHVESVAWVTERKDVLCALFWFLALWAWTRDAARTGVGRHFDTGVLFLCGLMAKPMIVTFPFTLLLLDAWPLRRRLSAGLFVEKWPFFVLSAASACITVAAQRSAGAIQSLDRFPAGMRIANALIVYWQYVFGTLWPANLAAAYPWPARIPWWQVTVAATAIAAVSYLVVRYFRRCGYLAFGWFWFLITLLPVIGLVQVGPQARADRYMYVPMVGLSVMLAWTVADFVERRPGVRFWAASLACICCVAMAAETWVQTGYWRNLETLFRHALAVNGPNALDYTYLASDLGGTSRSSWPEALADYQAALRLSPKMPSGHTNLGAMYAKMGRTSEAIAEFEAALRVNPSDAAAHDGLGKALFRNPAKRQEAIGQLRSALRIVPENETFRLDTASALLAPGATPGSVLEAIELLSGVLSLNPNNPVAHNLLGTTLAGNPATRQEGIDHLEEAIAINPGYAEAQNNLGVALEADERPFLAIGHLEEAVRLNPDYADARRNLGVAELKIPGREREGIDQLEMAFRLNPDPALRSLLNRIESTRPVQSRENAR